MTDLLRADAGDPTIEPPVALADALFGAVSAVVRGKDDEVRLALVALLAGGHLLVEDLPGTGTTVFLPGTGAWDFRPGPLFANVVLVDEVNRASPRTQAALLEPMEERQVSIDGVTRP